MHVVLIKASNNEDDRLSYYAVKVCIALLSVNNNVTANVINNIDNLLMIFEGFESEEGL